MTTPSDPVPDKTILLIGLMGAGKSAIGRRLARALDRPFVDSDKEVEAAAGCSIAEIFERYGEAAFRDCELRVMARLLNGPPCVLATGGGAFLDPQTRALVRERAVSVWLHADLDVLVERVSRRSNRPLLEGGDKRAILERLMAERAPVYAQADITVESLDGPHEATLERLMTALNAHGRAREGQASAARGG